MLIAIVNITTSKPKKKKKKEKEKARLLAPFFSFESQELTLNILTYTLPESILLSNMFEAVTE